MSWLKYLCWRRFVLMRCYQETRGGHRRPQLATIVGSIKELAGFVACSIPTTELPVESADVEPQALVMSQWQGSTALDYVATCLVSFLLHITLWGPQNSVPKV
eukprot:3718066-Amphidinium_carterae.1